MNIMSLSDNRNRRQDAKAIAFSERARLDARGIKVGACSGSPTSDATSYRVTHSHNVLEGSSRGPRDSMDRCQQMCGTTVTAIPQHKSLAIMEGCREEGISTPSSSIASTEVLDMSTEAESRSSSPSPRDPNASSITLNLTMDGDGDERVFRRVRIRHHHQQHHPGSTTNMGTQPGAVQNVYEDRAEGEVERRASPEGFRQTRMRSQETSIAQDRSQDDAQGPCDGDRERDSRICSQSTRNIFNSWRLASQNSVSTDTNDITSTFV